MWPKKQPRSPSICTSLFESLKEPVALLNEQKEVLFANTAFMQFFGKGIFVAKALQLSTYCSSNEFLKKIDLLMTKCKELQNSVQDSVSVHKDDMVVPITLGPHTTLGEYFLVINDTTPQQKMVTMGKEFIANASHELRTPITIVKGFAELLKDLPEISEAMLEDVLEKILRNCQRMETLISNLLVLADLDALAGVQKKFCHVPSLVDNCEHVLRSVHPSVHFEKELSFTKDMIHADQDLLELAITNLFNNAVKYSQPPASIKLIVKEEGDSICFLVEDKGFGISPEDQERVFDRFYTVDKARSRKLGGAGLGLSIVKAIVDKHGGKASVTSTLGIGSTFCLKVPNF